MLGLPEYASNNHYVEGFAEFFVAYAAAGNKLKEIYPAVFAFIDEIVDLAIGHPVGCRQRPLDSLPPPMLKYW